MKKVLKVASILAVVFAMLFALTGCGGNKLVATKDHDDNEKETVEISFNKDNEATTRLIELAQRIKEEKSGDLCEKIRESYGNSNQIYTGSHG